MIVDNAQQFHIENYKKNKSDYPLIAKLLSIKTINFFQRKGAKIHYNFFKLDNDTSGLVRYSIIDWKDFKTDMVYWDNLTVSVFTQKPIEELINTDETTIENLKKANLENTIAYATLMLINANVDDSTVIINEKKFFETILKIPVENKSYFSLYSNNFNLEEVLEDCLDDMKIIYLPYLERYKEYIKYNDKEKQIQIHNCVELREELIDNLPSKLISGLLMHDQNDLNKIIANSTRLGSLKENYDTKVRKAFVSNFTTYKQMFIKNQIKWTLKKHQHSRVFLIFMSKWFFIGFWIIKLSLKVIIVYYMYKKSGSLHIPFFSNLNKKI